VRSDSTIIVLNSGNYEFVGVRHRETQTLYISDIINPSTCKAPAYGKLHIGIYIAAIQDAISRMKRNEENQKSKIPKNSAKSNRKRHDDDRDDNGGDDKGGGDKGGGGSGSGSGSRPAKRRKKDDGDGPRGRGGSVPRGSFKRRTRADQKREQEERSVRSWSI